MYMYRNKSVVKTNGGVILFSVEKWIVNHWKDGPLEQVYMSVSKEPGAIWVCYCTALSSIPLVMENLWPKFFFMKNTVMVKN